MSVVETPHSAGLIARVQGILLRPAAEWEVIDGEAATPQGLFTGYACILAAIPAVATLIGGQIFGYGLFGVSIHPGIVGAIVGAVVAYGLSLASVFILSLVIDGLAPSFDGQKNQTQALKVAVYSWTAAWVAGIFGLVPMLAFLGLAGLYSVYLLYLGLPRLMKAPQEKALGYTAVTIIIAIVLSIIVRVAVGAVGGLAILGGGGMGAFSHASNGAVSGTVNVGGASVDLGKMQAAANAAAASAQAMQNGQAGGKSVAAIDAEKLKALLPDTVAGLPRTEISSTGLGANGGVSNAEAVYSKDNERITLKITDMAAASGFAAMAGAMNINANRETATGYEKTSTVNGRMTVEKWDRSSKNGEYSVIFASRFAVEADGSANSIDDLKAAVAAVGPDRLEGMAKG
jgi:hypothetical protein